MFSNMNQDPTALVLTQISDLLLNLNRKNYAQSKAEVLHLVADKGFESQRHLYRCLFSAIDFNSTSDKDVNQIQFLTEEYPGLLLKPNFVSLICAAIDEPLVSCKSLKLTPQLLSNISKTLKLTRSQEVLSALALSKSTDSEIRSQAQVFLKQKLPDLLRSYTDSYLSQEDTGVELLYQLSSLLHSHSIAQLGISQEAKQAFLDNLKREFPQERAPMVLAPLLHSPDEDINVNKVMTDTVTKTLDITLADMLIECGYGAISTLEECKNTLRKFDIPNCLTTGMVSQAIGVMARTRGPGQKDKDGLEYNNWNVDVFVQAVKELASSLSWRDVVYELDHPGFKLPDRQALCIVFGALTKGLAHESFPLEFLYRQWKNTEGQLSWFQQSLANQDVFDFSDYVQRKVQMDMLKSIPEEDRELAVWRSLDVVDTLLRLSDSWYDQAKQLFAPAIKHCPDVLVLSLLQGELHWNPLKLELLTNLIPLFLANHPNSTIILHYAWLGPQGNSNIRQLIMMSMAEWYNRGDVEQHRRLSRILDVAHDLKALSMLLNWNSFLFVIDLAILASRREYLKLDKWLLDKMNEHGDTFAEACLQFLHRKIPLLSAPASTLPTDKDVLGKSNIPTESVLTVLNCLQRFAAQGGLSQDVQEQIIALSANGTTVLQKVRVVHPPKPGPRLESFSLSPGFSTFVSGNQTPQSPQKPFAAFYGHQSLPNHVTSLSSQGLSTGLSTGSIPSGSLTSGIQETFRRGGPTLQTKSLENRRIASPSNDMSSMWPEIQQHFSKEIDDEANSYFQKIYNNPPSPTMTIDDVLEMLKRFKDSTIPKERDVFACMMRNLFEEYKFFSQYPDKELHTTACLFGGIIEHNLITYVCLGIALRYVLEALRKASNTKMLNFGLAALGRFKGRLKEWPQYCQHVAACTNFPSEFSSDIQQFVEFGKHGQDPPLFGSAAAGKQVVAVSKQSGPSLVTQSTNIDTLVAAKTTAPTNIEPPDALQDKVSFLINNLSQSNLQQKADELKALLSEEYLPWVSQYLVLKRTCIEPNFHNLYNNFLDTLKMPNLTQLVIQETFRNIKVLLQSEKDANNSSDRSLLKNLGHWLGLLTLAKNKPILQSDIDFKSLVIEAYFKGPDELLYGIPFVAKVLESCSKSKVFKPPNPWTLALMNTLAGIHQEEGLKLNLKFEIEVLCKTLQLEVSKLKPTKLLKNPEILDRLDHQLSTPRKEHQLVVSVPQGPKPIIIDETPPTATLPVTLTSNAMLPSTPPLDPPKPKYSLGDINVFNVNSVGPLITVNQNLMLFQAHPQMKQCVRGATERSVQELTLPVVERSIKIAMTTCECIIKKDFALDPDENRMRMAAHAMVRSLCAGMALITCREPLLVSIASNLKQAFMSTLRSGATQQQKELIDLASQVISQDNNELCCAFIQKSAIEKSLQEMNKRLATEFDIRKAARNDGRRYCDPAVLTYQAERMPKNIRLKVGGATPHQLAVYEEFARNIPGFSQTNNTEPSMGVLLPRPAQQYPADDITQIFDKMAQEIDQHLHALNAPSSHPQMAVLHSLLEAVIVARAPRDVTTASALLQKAVEGLLQNLKTMPGSDPEIVLRFRNCHLLVLKGLQDQRAYGTVWTNKHVTRFICEAREDIRFNVEAVDTLIRARLVSMQHLDMFIASSMDNGMNYVAVAFAIMLVKMYLIDDKNSGSAVAAEVRAADLYQTIETLARVAHGRSPPEGLSVLIDAIRSTVDSGMIGGGGQGPVAMLQSGISQAKEFDDPQGLHEKTEFLLREWVNMYHSPAAGRDSSKAFSTFVTQMHQQGILKTDDLITRFFRLCTEMCTELCYRALGELSPNPSVIRTKCYYTLDAFVRLIALLVKHSGDATNTITKVNLLNKVLGIIGGVLLQDHDLKNREFQQLPYHRIFIMLLMELNAPEHILESINLQVLTAFCNIFHVLRPSKVPGFAYAWLELVSHRIFIARLLHITPQQKGWGMYAQLLIDLLKFLAPFLRNADLTKPMQLLYKGTLRLLLILLHDFPEFLCDYYYGFCDVIPPNCVQMRNLILSSFPRNMRLPDPFTPNLKVDLLTEIQHAPRILTNFTTIIPITLKKDLDSYLKVRTPVTFLSELRSLLQVGSDPGIRYNISLMNALVLYVGTQAIAYIHSKSHTPSMSTVTHSSHMDIFQNLSVDLDTEGRYLFLNAICNQLRFPNSHTHYFSCTLLYLFAEANTEAIQEQITRVLLERLIVNRPHPWGLLITFIELIKNPTFKFWNHEFVRCAPEVEKLFKSVARSCMQPKAGHREEQPVVDKVR